MGRATRGVRGITLRKGDRIVSMEAVGEEGEILSRSASVTPGYYKLPEKTEELLEGGWLHSGDLGVMDEDGYIRITGRGKDMIIRGGENIYPREIEEVLFEHPQVSDVAIVGLPDAKWGEVIAAFIRDVDAEEPATDLELHDYLRQHLAPTKTPRLWYRVEEFPLTPSGKIQKFVLREQWESGAFG